MDNNFLRSRLWLVTGIISLLSTGALTFAEEKDSHAASQDYLDAVIAYADAMLKHGRDDYGEIHSPLFAEALDRATMRMPEGEVLEAIAAIPREAWGIRPNDRMPGGANPQHCLNLYQVLYALSAVTKEGRYAEAADASLRFFFETCQSPATGLFHWGEHAGWDLRHDRSLEGGQADTHEFYRPWVLWERSWALAPEPCRRFAEGLWEHQVGNRETGAYSRHAKISVHGPGDNAPYARHGGFYIEAWANAFAQTGDERFLTAIERVLDGLEEARLNRGGYLVGGSNETGARRSHDVSLAISLDIGADRVPDALAETMRAAARANDAVFAEEQAVRAAPSSGDADLWSNAYGSGARAGRGNTLMLRYRQTQNDVYRQAVLQEAALYRGQEVNLSSPVWPGTLGDAVWLMLNAHELTAEPEYLDEARRFARRGMELFLHDGPLPPASHTHDHYEAVTNGDTLIMALLRLAVGTTDTDAPLVYADR